MDFFFNTLKKGLVATLFVVFAFVATYTPQLPTSDVEEAQAMAGLANFATETTQWANNALLGANVSVNTANMGANVANFFKENVLDGLGWAITQRIVVRMIRSTLDWVASGFQGKPAFLQDFKGFILGILDEEIGRVISDLGGIGSFICSPFRLDVQIGVSAQYSKYRSKQTAPTCTLSGIVNNIKGFISGIDPGNGLRDWVNITATPESNTPYGSLLSAQAYARARLINAEGEEVKLLDFGDGYLSQKVCRGSVGVSQRKNCAITMPGQTIANQINETLRLPADLAITADEIDEAIVTGLMNLLSRALGGTGGILGLSGGDGFGGYSSGPTFLENLGDDADSLVGEQADGGTIIQEALDAEIEFRTEAQRIRAEFVSFLGDATNPTEIAKASAVIAEIDVALIESDTNITQLEVMTVEYGSATDDERVEILINFTEINNSLTSEAEAESLYVEWEEVANDLGVELEEE